MNMKAILSPYSGFTSLTWRLVGAGFMNAMGMVIVVYISLYMNAINFSVKQIGILLSIYGIAGLIGGYLGGILSDHFPAIKICKVSLFFNVFPLVLFPASQSYFYLLGMAFLLGLTSNAFRPAYILALTQGEKSIDMERIIALRRVAINLGVAFGAALFGFISIHSFSLVFFLNALVVIIAFFLLNNIKNIEAIDADSDKSGHEKTANNILFFYFILLLMFLTLVVFNQHDAIYPLYLARELQIDLQSISWLFAFSGLMIALFQMPLTTMLRNKNTHGVCAAGALLICLGYFILPICNSLLLIYLSCAIWTLGEMVFFPALLLLVLKLSGSKKGKRIGLYQLINSLALFSAPAIGTVIYSYEKNLFWHASGVIGLLVAISFLITANGLKKHTLQSLPA